MRLKQLKENETSPPQIIATVFQSCEVASDKQEKIEYAFSAELKKLLKDDTIAAIYHESSKMLAIETKNVTAGFNIDEFNKKVFENVQTLLKKYKISGSNVINAFTHIEVDELPSFPLKSQGFDINADMKEPKHISLHNCHKIITCRTMNIYSAGLIKDSVLGILLIKDLKDLWFPLLDSHKQEHKWFQIIYKHFKGDKDVMDCQEELIKAGLKEYAKL